MSLSTFGSMWAQRFEDFARRADRAVPVILPKEKIGNPLDSFFNIGEMWADIEPVLKRNKFYALCIVGGQGSGKTTVAKEFAQYALDSDFRIIYAQPEDFINDVTGWRNRILEDEKAARAKNCIVLDDLSYANDEQNRKQQAILKSAVARIRHIMQGQVFVIFVTHRLHAAPPMLRNGKSWIFSDMQSADRDDAQEVIGKNKGLREALEGLFSFISKAALDGARNGLVKFVMQDIDYNFKWGYDEDAGDGRLMAAFHGGRLGIFIAKVSKTSLNFDNYRYKKIEEQPDNE